MVSVYLFININCTGIRFGVDAFGSGIKDHTVDAFADWNAGDLLPRRRIDHHHDFAAATHKQAMRGFIDRQPDRHFPESERPTDNNRALFAVNHLDFSSRISSIVPPSIRMSPRFLALSVSTIAIKE